MSRRWAMISLAPVSVLPAANTQPGRGRRILDAQSHNAPALSIAGGGRYYGVARDLPAPSRRHGSADGHSGHGQPERTLPSAVLAQEEERWPEPN